MPNIKDVKRVKLPMIQRWNEKPKTAFKNNLDSISISLISYPDMDELRSYLPRFLNATWAETPNDSDKLSNKEKDELIIEALKGNALPTALETIGLVWQIEGISIQEVTHILRHRMASFSADCSADKWWTHKAALVPAAIQNSSAFYERYKKITEKAKELYCDMIDSKEVSILDARYILPRNLETFYFMRMNLLDTLNFIKQRMDKQIQPETDNVIAYKMLICLLEAYPVMNGIIDIHAPSAFYIKMQDSGKTSNIYFPDKDSDKFMWHEENFIYQKKRDELNGTDKNKENHFTRIMNAVDATIEVMTTENEQKLEEYWNKK